MTDSSVFNRFTYNVTSGCNNSKCCKLEKYQFTRRSSVLFQPIVDLVLIIHLCFVDISVTKVNKQICFQSLAPIIKIWRRSEHTKLDLTKSNASGTQISTNDSAIAFAVAIAKLVYYQFRDKNFIILFFFLFFSLIVLSLSQRKRSKYCASAYN